jgi:EmrB/QacA subfamily drug resistance transporter
VFSRGHDLSHGNRCSTLATSSVPPITPVRLRAPRIRTVGSGRAGHFVAEVTDEGAVKTISTGRRRWLALGVIGIAQLMVVLDLTVMNIALPSAQRALHFTTADRQWVVTAYSLAFGSLLLAGGKLADLLGRRTTFLAGLLGFAGVSAVGGASVNFAMLVTARACQGAFAALLVPSALAILTTTFTNPKDRAKAFGVYGAIATAGGAVGLLLGGGLTEYLSWRWTLYVNLVFAGVAFVGGMVLLDRRTSPTKFQLDIPGVLLASVGMFCLVFGFSNAATHSWHTPSTWGFLLAGAALLVAFVVWIGRTAHPLLPPRVVLNRNRSGAYVSIFIASLSLFATLLFLTYYLQQTLNYSPIVTGFAFLPVSVCLAVAANLSTIVLMPRVGPRPVVTIGLVVAAGAMAWLAQLGPHTGYANGVLGPLILAGFGLGMVIAPAINTGTYGVAPQDAGVASATVTVSQQLGASIGTSLLNTIFATAVASYLVMHESSTQFINRAALNNAALAHGYDTAFWWTCAITAGGAAIAAFLLRPGPLAGPAKATSDGGLQPSAELNPYGGTQPEGA